MRVVAESDFARWREIVHPFLIASREGDFDALLAVLAPDVVLRADEAAGQVAAANQWGGNGGAPSLSSETRGTQAVAGIFKGQARAARRALISGDPRAAWWMGGKPRSAFLFTVEGDRVVEIESRDRPYAARAARGHARRVRESAHAFRRYDR